MLADCVSPPALKVKNTFIHFDDDGDDCTPKRPSSTPPPTRRNVSLCIKTDAFHVSDSFSDGEVSTDCSEGDTSSVSGGSEYPEEAKPVETASRTICDTSLSNRSGRARHRSSPLQAMNMFEQRIDPIVAIVQAVLATCMWVESVEIRSNGMEGCSIVVTLSIEGSQYKDDVIALAKTELIQATDSVANVCTTGYKANPFVTTPHGFCLTIVGVSNKQTVCKGLLQTGFCKFRGRCRWEHPVEGRRIHVEVNVPEPSSLP